MTVEMTDIALGASIASPLVAVFIAWWTSISRGDRYLSHSSHHTQVPVPVTKPKKSPGLRKSGLCDKKEDGLHTPPAGNIFFCVVIIGDKTE